MDGVRRPLHGHRGVCRVFTMTFDGMRWTLIRGDPDLDVEQDWTKGRTWKEDFDLVFEGRRATDPAFGDTESVLRKRALWALFGAYPPHIHPPVIARVSRE